MRDIGDKQERQDAEKDVDAYIQQLCVQGLVFQAGCLALDTANDDTGSVLGDNLVVVKHLEF